MPRLLGFFAVVLLVLALARHVPVVGGFFHGLAGFWIVAALAALAASWLAGAALERRRLDGRLRALGQVDNPHNRGKLGALLASHGRFARALPHLDAAAAGEPDVAEWHYRRGTALLAVGRARDAVAALQRAESIDPRHAYGGVQIALARALCAADRGSDALDALARLEREHGRTPEGAYWRGVVLKWLGRKDEARAAFRDVPAIAAGAAAFERRRWRPWVWRALVARLH